MNAIERHGEALSKIIEAVQEQLTRDDWHFEKVEGQDIIRCAVSIKNTSFKLFFRANEEAERLTVCCVSPNEVPADKRGIVAEYITRANYGLVMGNLAMDMSDGEVHSRAGIDVEGGELTPRMVGSILNCVLALMDAYYSGLMAILYSGQTAIDAIKLVESENA